MLRRVFLGFFACVFGVLCIARADAACTSDQIDVLGDGTQCETAKFSVTTTSDATELQWYMSAQGTFYVDCGDGGTLNYGISKAITRTGVHICTWDSAGTHTVKFGGTATGYSTDTTAAAISFYIVGVPAAKIASIDGSLGAMFPVINGAIPRFYRTFFGCDDLTSIPAGLFSGIDTSSATDTSHMFDYTFYDCNNLTSIPAGLFSNIDTSSATDTSYMFEGTFGSCNNMSGYIPPTTFPSTIVPGSSSSSQMWYQTFYGTGLATSCPAGTSQYITGFESVWGYSNGNTSKSGTNRVSCEACSGTLPSNATYTSGCTWTCDAGYVSTGTSCEPEKFSVTTTSGTTSIQFSISATGTFYVDCGEGGNLTHYRGGTTSGISGYKITRTGIDRRTVYACTWASAGVHTIRFGGVATGYSNGSSTGYGTNSYETDAAISFYRYSLYNWQTDIGTQDKIASISGSIGAIFPVINGQIPRFLETFSGTSITSIPSGLFSDLDTSNATATNAMFRRMFADCNNLTSIPQGLFSNINTTNAIDTRSMFESTFYDCSNITSIPSNLFGTINTSNASSMFEGTFNSCSKLTGIPAGLFSTINTSNVTTLSSMFKETFMYCDRLTSLPSGLFSGFGTVNGIDTSRMFNKTFYMCSNLANIPSNLFGVVNTNNADSMFKEAFWYCQKLVNVPSGLFSNINTTNATNTKSMFASTFYGCSNITSIPQNLFSNINTTNATDTSYMFNATFYDDSKLTGYISPTTFPNTIVPGSSSSSQMWYQTFYGTGLATSCPVGTSQYITGFESDWGYSNNNTSISGTNRVSCEDCASLPSNATYTSGCNWTCDTGYYTDGNSCAACTNGPANSTYTGGASSNSCPWVCDDGYVENNGVCESCPAKPENASYLANSCDWQCDNGYSLENGVCVHVGCDTFTVTTTNLSVGNTIKFTMTATGNFMVDCGDGGTLSGTGVDGQSIVRSDTTATVYTCTYSSGGVKTIGFCGTATGYRSPSTPTTGDAVISFVTDSNTKTKIASIAGSMGAVFPTIGNGTAAGQQPMFYSTFKGASNLTAISAGLFDGVFGVTNSMFRETFDTTGLTAIPAGLFDAIVGHAPNLFRSAFNSCPITDIPEALFAGVDDAADSEFKYTFNGTSQLTGKYIKPSVFRGLIAANHPTASNMWANTFTNSTLLTSCPEGTTQFITGYESMWTSKVSCQPESCPGGHELQNGECVLANTCTGATYYDPNDTNADEYGCVACPTGYDADTTDLKDSITQCKISCAAGTYIAAANDTTCTAVDSGYYAGASMVAYGDTGTQVPLVTCAGATYRDANNTCAACPPGYVANTTSGKTDESQCQIYCSGGYYLANAGDATCSEVGDGYYAAESTVNYGGTSNRTRCPNPEEMTGTSIASSREECRLLCTGATYFDSENGECVACPTGYNANEGSGKTAENQCQISCPAGTYVAVANGPCVNVGDGYYSSAGLVNYGSTSDTRQRCPNDGTTGIDNATDILQCSAYCAGTQYYDSIQMQCVDCPSGYNANTDDGKTSVSQCQTSCLGGTYVPEPIGNGYTLLEYVETTGQNYINTGKIVSTLTNPLMSVTMQFVTAASKKQTGAVANNYNYKFGISNGGKFLCQAAGANMEVTFANADTDKHTFILDTENTRCSLDGEAKSLTVDGLSYLNAPIMIGALGPASGSPDSGRIGNVRFYEFKLISGGQLIMHLVPARNDTTNVIGMYDTVNGDFYQPSGTGALQTSQNIPTVGACVNVGDGYYAAASTVNYGSYGTRNTCPNNTATGKDNASSIYECNDMVECTGATYPNATTGTCTDCPTNYDANETDGKESINQCQISCDGGTYVATANGACINVGDGYYASAGLVNYGATSDTRQQCPDGGETGIENAADASQCISVVTECTGATYLDNGACAACPPGYDYNVVDGKTSANDCQKYCAGGSYLVNNTCVNVGAGYWAAGVAVNYGQSGIRNSCAPGLTTIGYGHGADEAADCGHVFHVGGLAMYARSARQTTPSLNIKTSGGDVFYLGLTSSDHNVSPMHMRYGNTEYTAYDDSLLYDERQ